MNVEQTIQKRRSIRRFAPQAVESAVLEKCIDAARLAPCGRNMQVCEYVTVTDETLLKGMFGLIGGSIKLPPEKGGPAPGNEPKSFTIVLINTGKEGGEARRNVSLIDVGMAAENLILTAYEQGIGCCPLLYFDKDGVRNLLHIPSKYEISLVIAMGYPAETPVAEEATGSLDSYVDGNLQRHVPKLALENVLHRNGFPHQGIC